MAMKNTTRKTAKMADEVPGTNLVAWREASRLPWNSPVTTGTPLPVKFIWVGAILRIADALESIAASLSNKANDKG